jgi:hypothetical protein
MTDPTLAEFRSIFGDEQNNYGVLYKTITKKSAPSNWQNHL